MVLGAKGALIVTSLMRQGRCFSLFIPQGIDLKHT